MSGDITVVLSAGCPHCNSFAERYVGWIEEDRTRTNVIMVDDITNRTVQDLLSAMRIDRFPAVLQKKKDVYCGSDAFVKMRELTGIAFDEANCGHTATRDLIKNKCINMVVQNIGA